MTPRRTFGKISQCIVLEQFNCVDFIILQTWWVCQMTDNYHLNVSFEHAGESSANDHRRLCIIHKTRRRLELVSIVINSRTQVVRRDYFQIDRTPNDHTGDHTRHHSVPPGRPSRIIDTWLYGLLFALPDGVRAVQRAHAHSRVSASKFMRCPTAELSQGSLDTVHLEGRR